MPKELNFGANPPVSTPNSDPVAATATPNVNPNLTRIMPSVTANSAVVPATTGTSLAVQKPLTMDDVSSYGTKQQASLASVTDKITGVAKTSDMDEVGKLLTSTIMAAKGFDPNNLFKKGFLGFFKAKANEIQMRFDTVDGTVNRLVQQIDQRIQLFRQRITDLDNLAKANRQFHDSLTSEIEEILARADWMEQNQPQVDPTDAFSAQQLQQWITVINFARKRADDLRRAQILAQQQDAQIALMKDNSAALALKFADVKVTTIPSMKTTFSLYVINMGKKKGGEFSEHVDDVNDEVLKRNAAMLGANTTAINKALTRSNIGIEALQANHDAIVNSLQEIDRIRAEMKTRIASEAPKIE